MKKLVLCLLVMVVAVAAKTDSTISMYVASVSNTDSTKGKYDFLLVICNNKADTLFVRRDDLDMIYPFITDDVTDIAEGGSFFYINGTEHFISDEKKLKKMTGVKDWQHTGFDTYIKDTFAIGNSRLKQIKVEGRNYYVIPPQQCITFYTLAQTMNSDLTKLRDISPGDMRKMQAHLVVPIRYFTPGEKSIHHQLLIARHSDDVRNVLMRTRRMEYR